MSLTISYKNDAYPEGKIFSIQGIGNIPNGSSVEISEEQEHEFEAFHGKTIEEAFADSQVVTLGGQVSNNAPSNGEENGGDE